ncbi:hypothetical protein E2P81_ATG03736 [Venturia nashicola]|nr:hypothetical protein E2P81_ATG03736 [Venturia nashicola]
MSRVHSRKARHRMQTGALLRVVSITPSSARGHFEDCSATGHTFASLSFETATAVSYKDHKKGASHCFCEVPYLYRRVQLDIVASVPVHVSCSPNSLASYR